MDCYKLTLEYIQVLGDIDRAIDKKSKAKTSKEDELLDKEITRLELKMMEIKHQLKNTEVNHRTISNMSLCGFNILDEKGETLACFSNKNKI